MVVLGEERRVEGGLLHPRMVSDLYALTARMMDTTDLFVSPQLRLKRSSKLLKPWPLIEKKLRKVL